MTQRAWPAWARASEIADLMRLSVPIAISRMSMMLMSLTDAIVLGQMDEGELPFVLNSWLPMGVTLGLGMGLLLGVQVLTAELAGRNQAEQSGRIFRRGLVWAIVLGIVATAVVHTWAQPLFEWMFVHVNPNATPDMETELYRIADETARTTRVLSYCILAFMVSTMLGFYLEALRRPMIVTWVMYIGVVVNLVIDLALVAGMWGMPQLGAEGVAWATTGSRWAITVVLFVLVVFLTPAFRPSRPGPSDEVWRQFSVGLGSAISNVAEWGGFNLTFTIATFISIAVNAVYGYTIQVMGICFMFFLGIASATSVRVAEHFGRGDMSGVKNASRLGVAATFVVGALLAAIVMALGPWIALGLVNADAEIDGLLLAPAITAVLIYAAVATTFDGLQVTASMALRAQEIVWLPTLIHIGSFFFLMIPLCYMFGITLDRGVQGMMEAVLIALLAAGGMQWALLEYKTARHKV